MDNPALIHYLRRQRLVVDYVYISAGAIFLYDYILTLHLEVTLIWFSRWSYTKVLFLVVRYMTFVSVWLSIWNVAFLGRSFEICKTTSPVQIWFLVMGIFLSEAVLAIRTWAIWNQNKVVGIGLTALTVGHLAVQSIMLNKYILTIGYAPPPFPEWRGCFVTKADDLLWVNFAAMAVVEAVIITLMGISAYWSYKRGDSGELSYIIYRDGIQLYVYLLLISVGNAVIMKALPFEDTILLSFMQEIMYPVLTTRIVINIREVGTRGLQTELHTTYARSIVFATVPLREIGDEHAEHDLIITRSRSSSPALTRWQRAAPDVNEIATAL